MEKLYYKSSKELADTLHKEWLVLREPVDSYKKEIQKEFGADSLYTSGDTIHGMAIKGYGNTLRGFKSSELYDEEEYTILKPIGTFKEGKLFNKMVAVHSSLVRQAPSFSSFVVDKYNVGRHVCGSHAASRSGMALYTSVAGVAKGVVVMAVPSDAQHEEPLLEEFTKIKKSEYIALTEE